MTCCPDCPVGPSLIENLSTISTIVTALASLALATYVFIYQRRKDNKEQAEQMKEIHRNVRLQWFKDAIIQPNLVDIYTFYRSLHNEVFILHEPVTDIQKSLVIENVKTHCYDFRKSFIELISAVDKDTHMKVQKSLDILLDTLTNNIFDEGINLSHPPTFNEKIEKPINNCKTGLFTILFNYEGHLK